MKVVAAFVGVLAVVALIGLIGWQLSECRKRLDSLEVKVAEQTNIAANQSRTLGCIAKSVPMSGGGDGYVVNLQSIMDDAQPHRDFDKVVVGSISRDSGELRIRNETSGEQRVRVNGEKWFTLPSGGRLSFTVPRGSVVAETEADGAKSWFIGPPDYRQELVIQPRVSDDSPHVDGMVVPRSPVAP